MPDRTGGVLVFAEQDGGKLAEVSLELLSKGRELADALDQHLGAILLGSRLTDQPRHLIACGCDVVHVADDPRLAVYTTLPYARIVSDVIAAAKPEVVIFGASPTGRDLAPRVAARLRTGLTADCAELDIDPAERLLLQTRPAIGGNIMATIKTPTARPQMATVRPKSCQPLPRDTARAGKVREVSLEGADLGLDVERLVEMVKDTTQEVNVQDAEIVVTGGKGVKNRDGFKLVEELAAAMGAAVGATRDVVDLGWAGYPHQIGLSGKTVSPRLYIAVGVSGSVQHLAGMQTSETIIAINKDKDAQIFKVADFGIVGDLFEVVPDLVARLKAGR